jgi:hypothetical protein
MSHGAEILLNYIAFVYLIGLLSIIALSVHCWINWRKSKNELEKAYTISRLKK